MMRLNLGCGTTMLKGYVNIDCVVSEFIKPDVQADASKTLPFSSDSVDEILASHIIEHFRMWELKKIFADWNRTLKPGGRIIIECPDLDRLMQNYKDCPDRPDLGIWGIFGDPHFKEPSMEHHWAYTAETLAPFLADAGFKDIKEEPAQFHEGPKREFRLTATKAPQTSLTETKVSSSGRKSRFLSQFKLVTCDDICPSNLKFWHYWDKVREKYPDLKIIAFVIANYRNKENVAESKEFKEWFEKTRGWVEIGVHGFDHLPPPEGERDTQEELITKALEILKPFLPEKFLFRAPGFQTTIQTEPILKKLGFAGIAHQTRIKYFDGSYVEPILNTHLTANKHENPIGSLWQKL